VKPAAGNRPRSGLALLRKPEGITSFKALYPVKRAVAPAKVGHAGTLDRFACGLLVVLVGSYSRLAHHVVSREKFYRGLVGFGSETSTLDPEGEVLGVADPPSRKALEDALPAFRGSILQLPPTYSAVHVGGKRAYEIARGGGVPELKERRVEIYSLELISYENGNALIEVRCSSGTYIRSLARDIAIACGSRAHLRCLERLSIGSFQVEDAVAPEAFDPVTDLRTIGPGDASCLGLRSVGLGDSALVARFGDGGKIMAEAFAVLDGGASAIGCESAVFGPDSELLGVALLEAGGPKYLMVMPGPAGTGGRP
jgi:tRNA pseudouridine55 synthase